MALAYSPSTQGDGSEYGMFQISLGYLWKPRHTYMHAVIINENKAMILKVSRECYIGGFGGRKEKGEM